MQSKSFLMCLLVAVWLPAAAAAQATDSTKRVDSLVKVINATKGDATALKAYIKLAGVNNKLVVNQLNQWIKQYPDSANFPYAIAEAYYHHESPQATPYLLKVAELKPNYAPVWVMLAIDAERWGNNQQARDYQKKAVEAEPNNAELLYHYAWSFKDVDKVIWEQKMREVAQKFPGDPSGAAAMSMLGFGLTDPQQKIKVYEELRVLYPPKQTLYSAVAMTRLIDLYLKQGSTGKAIELAEYMGNDNKEYTRFRFPEKLALARDMAGIQQLIREKKYEQALEKTNQLTVPKHIDAAVTLALLKAEVADAAGFTQKAYDSLVALHAKTPDDVLLETITVYGKKLGKTAQQQQAEREAALEKNAYPAPSFELGLYTSKAKAKLEQYRGKVILLTFWFPGCGPCRGEMPHFQSVVNKFDTSKLAYLGVNVFPEQDDYVVPFMKGTKYSFTPLRGTAKWAKEAYNVRYEPTNFVIDPKGRIIYTDFMIHDSNERMLELMIESLLI